MFNRSAHAILSAICFIASLHLLVCNVVAESPSASANGERATFAEVLMFKVAQPNTVRALLFRRALSDEERAKVRAEQEGPLRLGVTPPEPRADLSIVFGFAPETASATPATLTHYIVSYIQHPGGVFDLGSNREYFSFAANRNLPEQVRTECTQVEGALKVNETFSAHCRGQVKTKDDKFFEWNLPVTSKIAFEMPSARVLVK